MTAPTASDIVAAGYKMTANAPAPVVARCAEEVKSAYLLKCVTETEIANAVANSAIGKAWTVLTFLRYMQDTEFATRTGGERKRFEYGDRLTWTAAIKNSAARRLAELKLSKGIYHVRFDDICEVYYRTQLFH